MAKNSLLSEEKKAEKKKSKKGGRLLKAAGIILACIALTLTLTTVITLITSNNNIKYAGSFQKPAYEEQLIPEKDENGMWTFTTDEDFKILQLTDVHIGGGFMSAKKDAKALRAVAAMVSAEKPDLVIATGDIAYPVPFQAGTFNNMTGAKIFAALMEQLGCYWTLVYGNHDTEAYSYYSREKLSEFYTSEALKYCLFEEGPQDIYGSGNYCIRVQNSAGLTTQALICMDSNAYTDGDILGIQWKYDNIHPDQIEWYKNTIAQLNRQNADKGAQENVKSLCFFHIPLGEYKEALDEFAANGYKDTENVKYIYGMAGEENRVVYSPVHEDDMFETMLELGSTQGIFCGHDHFNNFSMDYKGIRLTYGMSVDFLAYPGIQYQGSQRGCTLITISPDGSFSNEQKNYYTSNYEISEESDKDVTFQFEGVSYQYFSEK